MHYSNTFCFVLVILSLYGDTKGQIVLGTKAEEGTLNFLVKLEVSYLVEDFNKVIPNYQTCAGTIIEWNWILTAAHCFKDFKRKIQGYQVDLKWKKVDVIAGVKDSMDPNRKIQSVANNDGRVFLHPGRDGHKNDVALIKLKQNLTQSAAVGTAVFLETPMDYDYNKKISEGGGVDCVVQGWGKTTLLFDKKTKEWGYAHFPQNAREAKIPLYKHHDGQFFYTKGQKIFPKVAPGDSGAPVVCAPVKQVERDGDVIIEHQDLHKNGLVYSVLSGGWCYGVNNFNESCQDENFGVDIRVVDGWIQEKIKEKKHL